MFLLYRYLPFVSGTKFIQYNPSMVAASIILTTRHTLGLVPCWTARLRRVSGYLKKDLVQCCTLLGYFFTLIIFYLHIRKNINIII